MATYQEIYDLSRKQDLLERAATACMVLADTIVKDAAATADDRNFAAEVFRGPLTIARLAVHAGLGANSDATPTQLENLTDVQLQAAVDAAKAVLVEGFKRTVV